MANPEQRFLLIGELAADVGVNPKTIRYYESIDLMPEPNRRPNGYRVYSRDDHARLVFIRQAQSVGLRLHAIRDILGVYDTGQRTCPQVLRQAEEHLDEITQQIASLQQLQSELTTLVERIRRDEQEGDQESKDDICQIIAMTQTAKHPVAV